MHAFFDDYRALVSNKIFLCLRDGYYYKFIKCFNIYTSNVRCHVENLSLEVNSIDDCYNDPSISRSQVIKWVGEIKERLKCWLRETIEFVNKFDRELWKNPLKRWLFKNRIKLLQKAISEGQRILNAK